MINQLLKNLYNNNQNYSDQDIRQKFNQKKNEQRKLLFLSRIHPKKGLIELVKAWERLRPNNWKVIVAGPDERGHKKEVEDLIKKKIDPEVLIKFNNDKKLFIFSLLF